jgi:serine/threonine-protein kinase
MALKARVYGVSKILLLLAGLLATYTLFALAAMRVAVRAREVVVPDLTGRSVNEATEVLAGYGMDLRVEEGRRVHPTVKPDHIFAQDPQPGVTARQQRGIKVWLSAGPRPSRVPGVVGETEQSAQLRLRADAFDLDGVAEIRSSQYPAGTVVAQVPPPDSNGTHVSLLVNRGERDATFVMPDLIGVGGDRAADLLRAHGFRVAFVADHPYPGVPPGIVLRQHPQAGFQIAPGEPMSLEVSR